MMTRKSPLSPARTAIFVALLSGSAMAAAQDMPGTGPIMESAEPSPTQAPRFDPAVSAPPAGEPPVIVPSTPPIVDAPPVQTQSAPPVTQPVTEPAPATKTAPAPQPKAAASSPVKQRSTVQSSSPDTASGPTAVETGPTFAPTATTPDETAFPVEDVPEPAGVMSAADPAAEAPSDNGNSGENWLIAAAALGVLGAAGGAAAMAGKRRRRVRAAQPDDLRISPATAAATPAPVPTPAPAFTQNKEPRWTAERIVAALNNRENGNGHAPRATDPLFATKMAGPPVTDPLFSAKIDVPPVTDPLFAKHPDYVGPGSKPSLGGMSRMAPAGNATGIAVPTLEPAE